MQLGEIATIAVNESVVVVGKVIKVDNAMEVKSKQGRVLSKQDCVLGDCSGSCRIVLWEGDVGKLIEGQCYRLSRVVVREYSGVKFLSLLADAAIEEIGDIGEVIECDEDELM